MLVPVASHCHTDYHVRVYPSMSNNESWGNYAVATTHIDYNEHCRGAQFGWSEDVEQILLAQIVANVPGVSWTNNQFDTGNKHDPGSWKNATTKTHYWQNSGFASTVYLPYDYTHL